MNQATKRTLHRGVSTTRPRFGAMSCFVGFLLVLVAVAGAADDGTVRRARLGVSLTEISPSMQKLIGRDYQQGGDAGVMVANVAPEGPAATASLRKGDVIVRLGSTRITSGRQLAMTVSELEPGKTIEITVIREASVRKTHVTLGAVDSDGRPSRVEPRDGGPANPVGAPITVTRYAPKLRELAARARDIEQRFARSSSTPVPQATVAALGTELRRLGTELERLLASSDTAMTRFGTIEEADLLEVIRGAHDRAAAALRAQALAELQSAENSTGPSRNQMRAALRNVGRQLIEREAVQWMRKNGLEALLVENGQSAFRGQVSQGIELNLRTFLDKKSIEVVGMPLGGFRSIQATFRLQARRQVRQLVAKLVLNFSGNQLVVQLLQRHIVRWIETDLWPQLREAFRPKTRLARRVRISAATMSEAGEALNNLVKGRRPADVPLLQVRDAVDRAEGKIYAALYLDRDLKRAKNQELIDQLQKAKGRLNRDIRRIRHQYLLANADRWDEMRDNLECTLGVHDDVGRILDAMREEDRRVRAAVQRVIRAMISEDTEGVMAVIHEQSPLHSREAATRLRAYFASHEMLRDNVDTTKITKQSDQDVKVTMVEMVGSSRQTFGLVFRRSGGTWKLYAPADGS
jgi:PDZ domain